MNIAGIDLNLLVAFEALLEERHVGRAARRVGLSQPALSNALGRLRAHLDDPLFVRTANGMRPTPRAEQLGSPIRAALAGLRHALEARREFDPSSSVRQFRIALTDDLELRLASTLARHVARGGLSVQTRRLDGLFLVPETELRHGSIDLAIGYFPDARSFPPSISVEKLSEQRNVLVARRGHPALRRRLTLEAFAALDHAAIIYRNEPWGLIDNELAARGHRRNLRLALPHCLSVLDAVASSDLVACVQEDVARAYRKPLKLSIHADPIGLPPFVVRMAWHRQLSDDPSQLWLRGLLRTALAPRTWPRRAE